MPVRPDQICVESSILTDIHIESLNQGTNPWRIDSIGELAYPNLSYRRTQPSIHVAISPVLVDPFDNQALLSSFATDTEQQRRPWCSLGTLTLLRVGDIWKSGTLLHRPDYLLQTFTDLEINQDSTVLIKAGLSTENKQFLLPLREHPWHRAHTQAYCLMIKLPENKQIVIPCWELIRFYFGSSSRLITTLCQYTLQKEMLFVDKTYSRKSKLLHLSLADGMPGRSATDIGRIAMDEVAWKAALRIATSCLKASTQGEPIYPNTFFPFEGKTSLVAAGKWLPFGEQENATFMVFNIRSCTHPFPFETLRYECTATKKLVGSNQNINSSYSDKPAYARSKPTATEIRLTDQDPAKMLTPQSALYSVDIKFPDLAHKNIWRSTEINKSEHSCTAIIGTDGEIQIHATGEPVSNQEIRTVELISDDGSPNTLKNLRLPGFMKEALATLQNNPNMRIQILYAGSTRFPVITIPKMVDDAGEIHPDCYFHNTNGSHRPRKAAILLVSECGASRYTVVLEGCDREANPQIIDICTVEDEVFSNGIDAQRFVAFAVIKLGKTSSDRGNPRPDSHRNGHPESQL